MSDAASGHFVEASGSSGNPFFAPADGRCLINDLPTELLSHIFMLGSDCDCGDCADDEDDDEDDCCSHSTVSTAATDDDAASATNSEHDRHLPFKLLVSRVCRQWREVAVGTPLLWNIINYEHPRDVERITEYVKRAKGAPLDISIDCTAADEDENDSEEEKTDEEYYQEQIRGLQKVVQILCPEVQHWRTFEVMVSDYGLMQSALNVLASCKSAPLLEELRLYHYEDSEERDEFEPAELREQDFVLFNNDVPRLREVALWGVHLNWERTTFLTGLEELELAYHSKDVRPSYREFLRILRASPKLQTLTICESGPKGMPTDWLESLRANPLPDTPPEGSLLDISLPSVKSLVLAYLSPPYVLALLDHLSFPKLTALAFDFEADEFMPVVERLTQSAPGTSKSLLSGLENLKISGLPCAHPPTLAAMADALKNLKSLSINLDHVDPLWDSILGRTENIEAENVPQIYFPQLESLYITAPQPDSIRNIVETRKERGKPLKELYINKDTGMDDAEESWFRDNVEVFDYFEGSDEESLYEFDASEVDVGEWDDPVVWDDEEEEEVDDEDFDDEDEIPF